MVMDNKYQGRVVLFWVLQRERVTHNLARTQGAPIREPWLEVRKVDPAAPHCMRPLFLVQTLREEK